MTITSSTKKKPHVSSSKLLSYVKAHRWWLGLIVVAIAVLIMILCQNTTKKSQDQVASYQSPDNTFATDVPSVLEENKEFATGALVTAFVDMNVITESDIPPYITVARGKVDGTLDSIFQDATEKYSKMNVRLGDPKNIKIDGESAKRLYFQSMIGERRLDYEVVFVLHNGILYNITAIAAPEDFPALQEKFDIVLSTWSFGDGVPVLPEPVPLQTQQPALGDDEAVVSGDNIQTTGEVDPLKDEIAEVSTGN